MLQGKLAIVTGSTSGIGLAVARALAREKADIVLNGFGDAEAIDAIKRDIAREFGVRVAYDGADMAKPAEIVRMVQDAIGAFGRVDIVVNNAGIQHTAPVDSFPPEKWDQIIAINLSSAFHTVRTALPDMRRRDWGRIVNIASVHGLVASVNKVAYIAAKHGVIGLTKTVALETATTGITCNAICPGWVLTPLVQKQFEDRASRDSLTVQQAKEQLLAEKMPSREAVTPEQIGAMTAFLCSDAAAQIRGAALPIDGAWTAQ